MPAGKLEEKARAKLEVEFKKRRMPTPNVIFSAKGTAGMPSTIFTVLIRFDGVSQMNGLIAMVNRVFDEAYWSIEE